MAKLQITKAQETEAEVVFELIRDLAVYEDKLAEFHLTLDQLRRNLWGDRRVGEALIAWIDGTAAGGAVCYRTFPTFRGEPCLFVEDLFVRPEWRRNGVGAELMRACVREAERQGCGAVQWWALDWNEEAIAFYDAVGAKRIGTCILHALDVSGE